MKKRILLMYISVRSGHQMASMAVEEALKHMRPDTEVLSINAFNYTNPVFEKIINSVYMKVIEKKPEIWDYLYDNPNFEKKTKKLKDLIHKYNSIKLKRLIEDFRPDAVGCTQAFPCGMIADYKKFYNVELPLFAILTDFNSHMYWIYNDVDFYCVASETARQRLIETGVDGNKIKIYGIPISRQFSREIDKGETLKKFNINSDRPNLLVMGGGSGIGPIKDIVLSLEKIELDFQILVITGMNKKLFKEMNKLSGRIRKNLFVFGYVDDLGEIMEISDIIITKPGGLTSAEALAKGLPMIIVNPIPGQEAYNTQYLLQTNAAIKADSINDVRGIVKGILSDKGKLLQMKQAAKQWGRPEAALDIAKLMLSYIN